MRVGVLVATIVTAAALLGSNVARAQSEGQATPRYPDWAVWPDSLFTQPYVDKDEWRDKPVRHRYVHGEFKGTEARFSLYFPPKEQYQGRFFQPVGAYAGNENAAQQQAPLTTSPITQENTSIGFAVASGGYLLETNNGALEALGQADDAQSVTVQGYRANAAAAQYSRALAAEMYGPHRPFGYVYGGSGGSKRTICGIENTWGVWDGSVPYVISTDMSMPNVFTVGAHAHRLLKDKWPDVVDALEPGGSGDMYATLNQEERDALREATRFGFPPRTWFAYDRLGYGPLASLINYLVQWDPQYFVDFWKAPGYLGTNPPESLKKARIQQRTTIARVIMSDEAVKIGLPVPPMSRGEGGGAKVPAAIEVRNVPGGELKGSSVIIKNGGAVGQVLSVASASNGLISLSYSQESFSSVKNLKSGDEIDIDNSIYLAAQTYHRHQVPGAGYAAWDQFRGADGKPTYVQRPALLGHRFARNGTGCTFTGTITGKMIVVESLMDEYAHPWQADWYSARVQEKMGSRTDDSFRLWYVDHAMHGAPPPGAANTHIVSYTTVLQQALRDLSAWVEKGVPAPANTSYKIVDGQVEVPATAVERKGVQPVVTLTANGGARAEVGVGQAVTFAGVIEVPPGTGKVVWAQWDFEGAGNFPIAGQVKGTDASGTRATVTTTYSFTKPGTYFPALRAASQRAPDKTPYAQIENLGRVRVVVK